MAAARNEGDDTDAKRSVSSRSRRGRPMLELAILGVLREGDLHGYELKKQLDDVLPAWSSVSFGSLYPALARLERAGAVAAASTDRPPSSPMTGALSGELAAFRSRLRDRGETPERGRRGRKSYRLTDIGAARLGELLTDLDPTDDRAFTVQVAFCGHLGSAERTSLLARRRAELAQRLQQARLADDAEPGGDPWRRSLREHAIRSLELDVAWLDGLLRDEQTLARPSGPEHPAATDLAPTLSGGLR